MQFSKLIRVLILIQALAGLSAMTGCYRPAANTRPRADAGLGQLAYDALAKRAGTLIVLDPRTGRVLSRMAHATDVQFETQVSDIAQLVTAYAALASGAITEKTLIACDGERGEVNVIDAIGQDCRPFFTTLSEKISPEAFAKSAELLGFVYYGFDGSSGGQTIRHIPATVPKSTEGKSFARLASSGEGMSARDLHFINLAVTLASGRTAAERFSDYVTTTAKGPAPASEGLNSAALATVRKGLAKAVEKGPLGGAATISGIVSAKAGGDGDRAVLISYAPGNPEVCLVVNVAEGGRRAAADVAGRFYQAYFKRK